MEGIRLGMMVVNISAGGRVRAFVALAQPHVSDGIYIRSVRYCSIPHCKLDIFSPPPVLPHAFVKQHTSCLTSRSLRPHSMALLECRTQPFDPSWASPRTVSRVGFHPVLDTAVGYTLARADGAFSEPISHSCRGSDAGKEAAKAARHEIWLSHFPERFSLMGSIDDQKVVAKATRDAINTCTNTLDESGHSLVDDETAHRSERERTTGLKAFNTSVFYSLPATIYTRMVPALNDPLLSPEV